MKQLEIIEQLSTLTRTFQGIQGALLIGSFARNTPKFSSDVDLSFWIDDTFDPHSFIAMVKRSFPGIWKFGNYSAYREHLTLYFSDRPKVDIGLFPSMDGLNRNFLGSEIKDISASILHDPNQVLEAHLKSISENRAPGGIKDYVAEVNMFADKFIFDFEQFSEAHRRSDAYKSYFFYNIALNAAVQLRHLARGNREFNFLPKNFATSILTQGEGTEFRNLQGSLYLPEINSLKRRLIFFFLESLKESKAISAERFSEISAFCDFIYSRDFIWNFRDISTINPKIKPKRIFRSSSLTRYQEEDFFPSFLEQHSIQRIIDLRDDNELAANPYTTERLGTAQHIHVPIDPRVQSDNFRSTNLYGTNEEIAYRYFALECQAQIKLLFESLNQPDGQASLIHCHAGKDRTGIMITLIHMLSGADEKVIQMDYQASEMDTRPALLNEFSKTVEANGGIESYLQSCGISTGLLSLIRAQILN